MASSDPSTNHNTRTKEPLPPSDNDAPMPKELERSSDNDATTTKEIERSSDNDATMPKELERSSDNDATMTKEIERSSDNDATVPKEIKRSSDNDVTTPMETVPFSESDVTVGDQGQTTSLSTISSPVLEVHEAGFMNLGGIQHQVIEKVNNNTVNNHTVNNVTNITNIYQQGAVSTAGSGPLLTDQQDIQDPIQDNNSSSSFKTVTINQLGTVEDILLQKGCVLLVAQPGPTKTAFLSRLTQRFEKSGYRAYQLNSVANWNKVSGDNKRFVVIYDAFGLVRFESNQYCKFLEYNMRSSSDGTLKLVVVFVIYPHIINVLKQYDYRSSVLQVLYIVQLQETTQSVLPYTDMMVRMLHDLNHGHIMKAVLTLHMQGQGHFLNNVGKAGPQLKELGFFEFSDVQLDEYSSLFQGFLFPQSGTGFICRSVYQAAGLALAQVSLEPVLLKVCDTQFLVQHVRTETDTSNSPRVLIQTPENRRLLVQRMQDEIMKGRTVDVCQHPCLYSDHFLQEFQALCQEEGQLQQLMRAVDQQHGLPLLYWSVWGPSFCLTHWCLDIIRDHCADITDLYQPLIMTAFVFVLLKEPADLICKFLTVLAGKSSNQRNTSIDKLVVPLFSEKGITQSIIENVKSQSLQYLGKFDISADIANIHICADGLNLALSCQQPYLVLRLLSDRQVDETDSEGNTLLHLAADTGHLKVIQLAVRSGGSLTVKNKAGYTPPQVAARRRQRDGVNDYIDRNTWFEFNTACCNGDMNTVKTLLCHSISVQDTSHKNLAPLHYACRSGHIGIISLLIKLDADVNAKDNMGNTVLQRACIDKGLATISLLIENGADVNVTDQHCDTPVHIACREGLLNIVTLLVENRADVNTQTRKGYTPLHIACDSGHKEISEVLLQHKADVTVSSDAGHPPLALAWDKEHWEIAQLLIQYDADVNQSVTDSGGDTMLHVSCREGHTKRAEFLLQHKADVDARNTEWETALHVACDNGHTDIVGLLLKHNAQIDVRKTDGQTALDLALQKRNTDIVRLLQHDRNVEVKGSDRYTTFDFASVNRKINTQLLSSFELHRSMPTNKKLTSLFMACASECIESVRSKLQTNSSDVNSATDGCWSPLHLASYRGLTKIAKLLLQHNADGNITDKTKRRPLIWACVKGHSDIVGLLLLVQC